MELFLLTRKRKERKFKVYFDCTKHFRKHRSQNNRSKKVGSNGEINRKPGKDMIEWEFQISRTGRKKLINFFS